MKLKIPPPIFALTTAAVMWSVARFAPSPKVSFPFQTFIGFGVMAVGLTVGAIAVVSFLRARTTIDPMRPEAAAHLVTDGLYRFSRNPMYAALLLVLSGFALRLGDPLNILALIAFVAAITHLQIKPEEAALSARFGAEFEAYRRRVRRWL